MEIPYDALIEFLIGILTGLFIAWCLNGFLVRTEKIITLRCCCGEELEWVYVKSVVKKMYKEIKKEDK